MSASVSLTQSATLKALRSFLLGVLPAGVQVVRGQDNRVPEPLVDNFVVMTPIRRERLATNVDSYEDAYFTGSIAGGILTVTSLAYGQIVNGRTLFGVNVAANTTIGSQITGAPSGGIGTYNVSPSQTVSSQPMAAGITSLIQETKVTVQLDVHGPASADNAQIISTIFRDEYGITMFDPETSGVTPLYTDDPRQIPFTNEEQQVENRWIVEAVMQVNPVVTLPLQFADILAIGLINVESVYPALGTYDLTTESGQIITTESGQNITT